jgi:adenosine deaminase
MCDVCPVSNVRLGVVPDLAAHPAAALVAAGVPVSLNADDPLWFGRSIVDQYEIARRVWGFDDEALAQIARHSSTAAGMSAATREAMSAGITAWLDDGPEQGDNDEANNGDNDGVSR